MAAKINFDIGNLRKHPTGCKASIIYLLAISSLFAVHSHGQILLVTRAIGVRLHRTFIRISPLVCILDIVSVTVRVLLTCVYCVCSPKVAVQIVLDDRRANSPQSIEYLNLRERRAFTTFCFPAFVLLNLWEGCAVTKIAAWSYVISFIIDDLSDYMASMAPLQGQQVVAKDFYHRCLYSNDQVVDLRFQSLRLNLQILKFAELVGFCLTVIFHVYSFLFFTYHIADALALQWILMNRKESVEYVHLWRKGFRLAWVYLATRLCVEHHPRPWLVSLFPDFCLRWSLIQRRVVGDVTFYELDFDSHYSFVFFRLVCVGAIFGYWALHEGDHCVHSKGLWHSLGERMKVDCVKILSWQT